MSQASSSNRLLELIKKATGTYKAEKLNLFVGVVKSVDLINLVCSVEPITSQASFNGADGNTTNTEWLDDVNNKFTHDNVCLMSGGAVDDGYVLIPEIDSQV